MSAKEVIVFPSGTSAKKRKNSKAKGNKSGARGQKRALPQLTREAALSFLKDTRGMASWTASDMVEILRVTLAQANDALPILEMQGYVKRSGKDEWLTTIAGETLSGSAAPRFRKEAVDEALEQLRGRIRALNANRTAKATVTKAVAFGDFLSGRAQAQAADVGVELKARGREKLGLNHQVLTALRARSPMLHLHAYADWMSQRTNRKLI